ncbi:M20 family metallo-hydrolase [Mariprofundus erugo]|uniref:hydantoinase/carbamoylase family amidase n=1 Tax=Mariprofundus erugo TaxID=2528639 RepID=UPI0010FCEEDF|nr:hydantoinase/carbamoylase family amidase [Mariprofundus erugo]TLS75632.1 M20 family metallo-hydrolase [Mariprofundus erugo]
MPHRFDIPAATISGLYRVIDRIGNLGPGAGFLRAPWSDEESLAMQHIESAALAAGLTSRRDPVGNLIIETPGVFAEWVETGSHMDTVPGGGNFDGTAGVVAGLAAITAIFQRPLPLQRGLRLRIWRGEESSTFGTVSAGSRAALGLLDPAVLTRTYQNRTLAEAITSQGGNPGAIRAGLPLISSNELDGIVAHIELHIEQGSILEQGNFDLGIVTGIRGSSRRWVHLEGAFDHSGATPMGTTWRRDANLAMAYMQVRLDQLLSEAITAGADLVQTVGVVNASRDLNDSIAKIYNNAVSKVSGYAYFSHEVRGCNSLEVHNFSQDACDVIRQTAAEFGITVEIDEFSVVEGIPALDYGLQQLLNDCCHAHDASTTSLASGAWHDVAALHRFQRNNGSSIAVGMLFVPCRSGISHSPDEYTSPEQLALGASVLASALASLACHPADSSLHHTVHTL